MDNLTDVVSSMEDAALNIFIPVLESSVVFASHYCKAAGRSVVTAHDMIYGMMYAARYIIGKHEGSLFPEIYDESDSEDSEFEEVQETDEDIFTRYKGTDNEHAVKMNECADTWNTWEPETPAESALKNAVNKAMEQYV
jgi:hypothetical protein